MEGDAPAVKVERLRKSFLVPKASPEGRIPLLRQRTERRELFPGIDFEVEKGEFFGIVGRNGSGKSTLLKLIAGIYAADSGRIDVVGRLAPVLDLAIGFNPELPTRDNAVINAVMLGLSGRQARARADAVLEFAELSEFAQMKLKNLSSGMRVRLAFATVLEIDPDVTLLDEVLAVGDQAFQEKCAESMMTKQEQGKTIILVSHSMAAVERLCSRAMLLENGRIERIGDPGDVAARYLELNLEHAEARDAATDTETRIDPRWGAVHLRAWLSDGGEGRRASVAADEPLTIAGALEVVKAVNDPALQVQILNERGARMFMPEPIAIRAEGKPLLRAGDAPVISLEIENRLVPGTYTVVLSILRTGRGGRTVPASRPVEIPFQVAGSGRHAAGIVALRHRLRIEPGTPRAARVAVR